MDSERIIDMELINIRDLFRDKEKYLGNKVTVGGWVRSVRDSKTFGFIVVNDGTFFEPLQVVYHDTMENFTQISKYRILFGKQAGILNHL